jgi:anti-sigma-K factor RskA
MPWEATMSDIHALSGAYAVNALDDVERAAFERHLADCEVCAAEVAGLREAAATMTHAVSVSPPPALRDRLMAQVATTRVLPPVTQPTRARPRRSFLVAAAAAAVIAVGGGVVATQPWTDDNGRMTASEQVLTAGDAHRVSGPVQGGGRVTVVRSDKLHEAVLLADGVPPAPSGRVYQVWFQNSEGRMVSAGLMPAGKDSMLLAGDPGTAQAVGITVEPRGGSESPTTTPVALVELA